MKFLKRLFSKEESLLKDSLYLVIGSIIGGVFNYLFNVSVGRVLGPEQFGIIISLTALIAIESTVIGLFGPEIIKNVADYNLKKEKGMISNLLRRYLLHIGLYGFFGLLLITLFSKNIAQYMQITDSSLIILTGGLFFFSALIIVPQSFIIGLQKFKWASLLSILQTTIKFLFALVILYLGFKVKGLFIGLLIVTIITLIISFYPIRELFKYKLKDKSYKSSINIRIIIISLCTVLFFNVDQILIKHFFNEFSSGLYGATSTIAKIPFFILNPITLIILSKVSLNNEVNNKKLLKKALLCSSLIIILFVLGCFIFPELILKILYGHLYLQGAKILGLLSLSIGLFSLSNMLIFYSMGVSNFKILPLLFFVLLAQIGGIYFYHGSLFQVVAVLCSVNLILFISLLVLNKKSYKFLNRV